MKIIGGKRDYYDYLVGYYGYDDHIVYDRRNKEPLNYKGADRFIFHICGEEVPVIKKGEDFIFDPNDKRISDRLTKYGHERIWMSKHSKKKTDLNLIHRQPVLCQTWFFSAKDPFIPCLADFGFPSIFPANEMYEKIYAYLGWLKDNPAPVDNQTDGDKVVAHGFSKITSFRPKIKL